MARIKKIIWSILVLFSVELVLAQSIDFDTYRKKIDHWHQKRIERLTDPEGWLSLAGLYWLKEGENTFGFGDGHDIVFPDGEKQLRLGTFTLKHNQVLVKLNPHAQVLVDSNLVGESILKNDLQGRPTRMERGRFLWYVIKRDQRFGIRLKDRQNPKIKKFKGIKRFPVDLKWRIRARFVPYDSIITLFVPTVLGTKTPTKCPGELHFEINGHSYALQVLADSEEEPFFIIFSDETNGQETYGAGRFLYVDPPDKTGWTLIDFNKAYNPPCAFTEFATCPLPPKKNYLPLKVTAGEMAYEGGTHH